jgi:hypothetical protein
VVLPARAHDLAIEAATQMLGLIARFVPELFAGFTRQLDRPTLADIQNRIGEAFARFDRVAAEATHERITRISPASDQGPLLRTLLRLRHDIKLAIEPAGQDPGRVHDPQPCRNSDALFAPESQSFLGNIVAGLRHSRDRSKLF